jgi:spore coat protein CotF
MITEEEIKKIEALADKYIRKSDCKLTESANIEFRKGLKKRIIELLEMRDQTKPYSPILQKK